jgi:hypothetical protein
MPIWCCRVSRCSDSLRHSHAAAAGGAPAPLRRFLPRAPSALVIVAPQEIAKLGNSGYRCANGVTAELRSGCGAVSDCADI